MDIADRKGGEMSVSSGPVWAGPEVPVRGLGLGLRKVSPAGICTRVSTVRKHPEEAHLLLLFAKGSLLKLREIQSLGGASRL